MKEKKRKCLKCGASPYEDSNIVLYRFPKPGIKNPLRAELWAKYCFPDKAWSSPEFQKKLYSEHRMLCYKHFKETSFIDYSKKTLHRHAAPHEDCDTEKIAVHVPNATDPIPGPSSAPEPIYSCSRPALVDITTHNINSSIKCATALTMSSSNEFTASANLLPTTNLKKDNTSEQKLLYMKCRKNMKKICQLRNSIYKLKSKVILNSLQHDNAVKVLARKITPTLALLLQGEIKNFNRKTKGRRWTKEQKIIALRLYKRSSTCYRLLRRLFCLPAPSTLKALLNKFLFNVGITKKVFQILKKFSATQELKDNEYILMFDEISIRKHIDYNVKEDKIEGFQDHASQGRSPQIATHALVFMICGIRKKLKQPVAFYLSGSTVTGDRLAVLIKEVLYHCFGAGLNVSATVCDMDGVNRRALAILGATSQNPCIVIYNHEITTMFDPPHLIKCFRNLLMKYDIKYLTNISSGETTGRGVAKWSHIKQFYELDNTNPNFVFAPSLRQEHLNPNTKQKMRVKLAAQVFSHSVAAGMYCKISQGELTAEATVTADLVANIDRLFDCLNSDTPDLRRGKPYATNLRETTPHLNLMNEMKRIFQTLELIGCRSKPPSIEGWVWTLNAVEIYWKKLITRHPNIRSLSTRRLQQDPLENLFGCIRGHCGSNTNPTAVQFIAGLKTAVLSCLASAGTRNSGNCENDENQAILDNFKMLLESENPTELSKNDLHMDIDLSGLLQNVHNISEESVLEVTGEVQACAYVCGFIIKKYRNHCNECKQNLIANNIDMEHNFLDMREYSEVKRSLMYASKELIKCVEYCATVINKYMEHNAHEENLKLNIVNILLNEIDFDFLKCSSHSQDLKQHIAKNIFYICIKRFCTLKNRQYVEETSASLLQKKINILKHT